MTITLQRVRVPRGAYDGKFPARASMLDPWAAAAWIEIADRVVPSDMFRSAEGSLLARRKKRGVQPPGYSHHNFGGAIDLDIGDTKRWGGFKNKSELDTFMAAAGWICHRLDSREDFEAWHYNFLGDSGASAAVRPGDRSSAPAAERRIQALHGAVFAMKARDLQSALAKLRMYQGAIDGKIGPLSLEGARAFARAWDLPEPASVAQVMTAKFTRTLALVSAEVVVLG